MAPVEDVHSVYARLRREDPVHPVETPMGRSVFVSRFADVHAVLKDHETFSSRSNGDRGIGKSGGTPFAWRDTRQFGSRASSRVYEHNGDIPEDHVIHHQDEDPLNCDVTDQVGRSSSL